MKLLFWRKPKPAPEPKPEPPAGYKSLAEAEAALRRGEITMLVYEKGTIV
jgi:hypothetical protein